MTTNEKIKTITDYFSLVKSVIGIKELDHIFNAFTPNDDSLEIYNFLTTSKFRHEYVYLEGYKWSGSIIFNCAFTNYQEYLNERDRKIFEKLSHKIDVSKMTNDMVFCNIIHTFFDKIQNVKLKELYFHKLSSLFKLIAENPQVEIEIKSESRVELLNNIFIAGGANKEINNDLSKLPGNLLENAIKYDLLNFVETKDFYENLDNIIMESKNALDTLNIIQTSTNPLFKKYKNAFLIILNNEIPEDNRWEIFIKSYTKAKYKLLLSYMVTKFNEADSLLVKRIIDETILKNNRISDKENSVKEFLQYLLFPTKETTPKDIQTRFDIISAFYTDEEIYPVLQEIIEDNITHVLRGDSKDRQSTHLVIYRNSLYFNKILAPAWTYHDIYTKFFKYLTEIYNESNLEDDLTQTLYSFKQNGTQVFIEDRNQILVDFIIYVLQNENLNEMIINDLLCFIQSSIRGSATSGYPYKYRNTKIYRNILKAVGPARYFISPINAIIPFLILPNFKEMCDLFLEAVNKFPKTSIHVEGFMNDVQNRVKIKIYQDLFTIFLDCDVSKTFSGNVFSLNTLEQKVLLTSYIGREAHQLVGGIAPCSIQNIPMLALFCYIMKEQYNIDYLGMPDVLSSGFSLSYFALERNLDVSMLPNYLIHQFGTIKKPNNKVLLNDNSLLAPVKSVYSNLYFFIKALNNDSEISKDEDMLINRDLRSSDNYFKIIENIIEYLESFNTGFNIREISLDFVIKKCLKYLCNTTGLELMKTILERDIHQLGTELTYDTLIFGIVSSMEIDRTVEYILSHFGNVDGLSEVCNSRIILNYLKEYEPLLEMKRYI